MNINMITLKVVSKLENICRILLTNLFSVLTEVYEPTEMQNVLLKTNIVGP